jgi:peptidoglycan/LPS O-acetylase OafA/YrhL
VGTFLKYEDHLDGLRAISILLVMCNHMEGGPPIINGSIGVDIFFAISGFLITNILLIEFEEFGDISLKAYFVKRVFRIFPLYFTTIFIYVIASFAVNKIMHDGSKLIDLYEAFPYLITVNEEFMFNEKNTLFGQAWSVGIGEKFCLLWPQLFLFFNTKRKIIYYVIVGAIIAFIIFIAPSGLTERGYSRAYFELIFASFMTIVIWRYKAASMRLFAGNSAFFVVCGAVLYYIFRFGDLLNILVSVIATFTIISLHISPEQRLACLLSFKPLVFLGKLSYGVYLIHVLAIHFVAAVLDRFSWALPWSLRFLVALIVSMAASYVLRVTIERPMVAFGRSQAKRLCLAKRRALAKPAEVERAGALTTARTESSER